MNHLHAFALIASTLLTAGCAAPATNQTTASADRETCMRVVGSNICRRDGQGNMNNTMEISGDALRRSGGPITGPTLGKTGD